MTWGAGEFVQTNVADAITIKGGLGSKDAVTVSYADDAVANTGAFTMTGVETLNVTTTHAGSSAGVDVLDLTNASGITTIQLETGATNPNGITINQMWRDCKPRRDWRSCR